MGEITVGQRTFPDHLFSFPSKNWCIPSKCLAKQCSYYTVMIATMHWHEGMILALKLTFLVELWALCLLVVCHCSSAVFGSIALRKGPQNSDRTPLCDSCCALTPHTKVCADHANNLLQILCTSLDQTWINYYDPVAYVLPPNPFSAKWVRWQ